jgi:hypothetical protein
MREQSAQFPPIAFKPSAGVWPTREQLEKSIEEKPLP